MVLNEKTPGPEMASVSSVTEAASRTCPDGSAPLELAPASSGQSQKSLDIVATPALSIGQGSETEKSSQVDRDDAASKVLDSSNTSISSSPTSTTLPTKTRQQTLLSNFQFAAVCGTLFIVGWNDGTTGPLIPRMRQEYNVRLVVPNYSGKHGVDLV